MPRTATVARSRITHSGRSSDWIDTRSPGWTPSASSAHAASSIRPHVVSHVYSCQIPKSFSRMAICDGARCAQSRASVATVTAPDAPGAETVLCSVSVMSSPDRDVCSVPPVGRGCPTSRRTEHSRPFPSDSKSPFRRHTSLCKPWRVHEYVPPLRDIAFVMEHVAGLDEIVATDAFGHVDTATIHAVLEEVGRFMADV